MWRSEEDRGWVMGADCLRCGGVVLQDGRSAYCCVCDDAGFWVRGVVCLVDLPGGGCTFIMSTIGRR